MGPEFIIIAIVTAIFGSGGIVAYRLIKPQSAALLGSSTESMVRAAVALVEPLQRENADLRDRVSALEEKMGRVQELESKNLRLTIRVRQLEVLLEQHGVELPPVLATTMEDRFPPIGG